MRNNIIFLLVMGNFTIYLLIMLAPIKISKLSFLYGMFLSIILIFTFIVGLLSLRSKKNIVQNIVFKEKENKIYFIYFILSLISTIYSIQFYTGKNIDIIFANLFSGKSNYNEYQIFFESNILALTAFQKITGILSQVITKIILLYSSVSYFIFETKKSKFKFLMVFLIFALYVFFGLSRGTFFEIFEIILIAIFLIFIKNKIILNYLFSLRFLLLLVLCFFILLFYQYNLSMRYMGTDINLCMTQLICYDEGFEFPVIGKLLVKLMAYFGFPFLYMSHFIEHHIFYSFTNLISILGPLNGFILELNPRFLCDSSLDCGASWSPLVEKMLLNFGLIFSLLIIFIIGFVCATVMNSKNFNVMSFIFIYYVFLFMFSLPINDFVFAVSSNAIVFIISTIFVLNSNLRKNVKS